MTPIEIDQAVQAERDAILALIQEIEDYLIERALHAGAQTVDLDLALGTAAFKFHELADAIKARGADGHPK